MIEVTVVIPVKNEESIIELCLDSLQGFADIVVVDSGSTDRTLEIAKKFYVNILNFDWNGQFPKKRNWVLQNYSFLTDWVLFLDADEILTDKFKEVIVSAIQDLSIVGYWLRYDNYFQGKLLKYGVPMKKLALFRVGSGEYEKIDEKCWSKLDMEIHEHPILSGKVGQIKESIIHYDYRGMHNYIAKHNEYSSWEARRYFELSQSNFDKLTRRQKIKYQHLNTIWWAPVYFFVSYFIKLGFLDGRQGFIFSLLKAIYFFEISCKIREIEKETPHSYSI